MAASKPKGDRMRTPELRLLGVVVVVPVVMG
jgi:hypothetical protein